MELTSTPGLSGPDSSHNLTDDPVEVACPSVTVRVPGALRELLGGDRYISIYARTIGDLVSVLAETDARISSRLLGEDGKLRRFVNIYVNEEDIRFLSPGNPLEHPLEQDDDIAIIAAIAGGGETNYGSDKFKDKLRTHLLGFVSIDKLAFKNDKGKHYVTVEGNFSPSSVEAISRHLRALAPESHLTSARGGHAVYRLNGEGAEGDAEEPEAPPSLDQPALNLPTEGRPDDSKED